MWVNSNNLVLWQCQWLTTPGEKMPYFLIPYSFTQRNRPVEFIAYLSKLYMLPYISSKFKNIIF